MGFRKIGRQRIIIFAVISFLVIFGISWRPTDHHLLGSEHQIGFVQELSDSSDYTNTFWISDHEILFVQGDTKQPMLFRIDVRSNKKVFLASLTQLHSASHGNGFFQVSPNGHWVVWLSYTKKGEVWAAAALDGSHNLSWPRARTSEMDHVTVTDYSYVRWLGNSRQIAEFITDEIKGQLSVRAVIHNIYTGKSNAVQSQNRFSDPLLGEVTLTQDDKAIAATWDALKYTDLRKFGVDSFPFYRWSISDPTSAPHRWTVNAPVDTETLDMQISPNGKKLARRLTSSAIPPWQRFLQRIHIPFSSMPAPRWEIWVSNIDGTDSELIGYEKDTGEFEPYMFEPCIKWSSDSKHLLFVHKGRFYSFPTEENVS